MTDGTHVPAWGAGDPNSAYLDKTLRHRDVELRLDEGVSWRFLFLLGLRAFIASSLVWLVFVFFALIAFAASGGSNSRSGDPYGYAGPSLIPSGVSTAFTVLLVGGIVSFVVFWVVLLLLRVPEPVAEWRVLLADRATNAESVYSQISGTLLVRQFPIGGTVMRIRTGPGPQHVSNRLVLTAGHYTAYVSVFPYGTSLYLGWMMWRSRWGAELIWQFFVDLFEGISGRNSPERRMMRTEGPRAMREAVHAACREGLFVGVEGTNVPVEYGFPQGLPQIQDTEFGTAPVPGQYPPGPPGPPVQ